MKTIRRRKSPSNPKIEHREERRSSIVQTACKLFAGHGYDDCDMDCVAEKLKIAKGTLYLYFAGKQELFFSCVDVAMRKLQDAIFKTVDKERDPLVKISNAIRAYVVFFAEHPEYAELMILERAIFRNRKQATYFKYRKRNREYWRGLYTQLIESGRIRTALKTDSLLEMIGNLVYGTMFTNHFQGRRISISIQHKTIMTFAFSGLLSQEELNKLLRMRSRNTK